MNNKTNKSIFDTVTDIAEKTPEVYDDGLKPTVQSTGKLVSIVPRTINAALAPLWIWILHKEHSIKETEALLAKRLDNISVEKIQTPDSYVGIPALQAVTYCMDSEELRSMYANLLANAMNIDTKNDVHPAFVEIIKQMSPIDAKLLKYISTPKNLPICNICLTQPSTNTNKPPFIDITQPRRTLFSNYMIVNDISFSDVSVSVSNLQRLGLIELDYQMQFSQKGSYLAFAQHPFFMTFRYEKLPTDKLNNLEQICLEKGILYITPIGEKFTEVCINELNSQNLTEKHQSNL